MMYQRRSIHHIRDRELAHMPTDTDDAPSGALGWIVGALTLGTMGAFGLIAMGVHF